MWLRLRRGGFGEGKVSSSGNLLILIEEALFYEDVTIFSKSGMYVSYNSLFNKKWLC